MIVYLLGDFIMNLLRESIKLICFMLLIYYVISIVTQFSEPRGRIGISLNSSSSCKAYIFKLHSDYAKTSELKTNDCIINVNDENVSEKNRYYVANKIQGKPNTTVNITVRRDNKNYSYTLTRQYTPIDWLRFLK